mmetsp:Transcript_7116/g.16178  ORF Transcript_7116/g.16178 Transcript_7116/m.16178 type:complete len:201 (-) Transcript_7116:161-763(-)
MRTEDQSLTSLSFMSRKFIPLLIATSPRFLGYATAFAPPSTANSSLARNFYQSSRLFSFSDSNMADEVAAAKAAAAEYKSSDNDGAGPATVFDNILSGKWPSDKVHEDDLALAFRDITPQAPVHIVVIPKNRDGLTKLSNAREDQKDILGHLMYVAQSVGKKECPDGFRIVINDGEHGAQSVYHLHLHVLGGRQLGWPPG